METSKPHKEIVQYMMHLSDADVVGLVKSYQILQQTGQFWDTMFQKLGEKIADELGDSYDIQRTIVYVQDEVFRRYLLLMGTSMIIVDDEFTEHGRV